MICCKLADAQEKLYQKLISGKAKEEILDEDDGEEKKGLSIMALAFITNLKKLCNHPQLIYNKCAEEEPGFKGSFNSYVFLK